MLASKVVGMVGVMYTKMTGAQKRVTVKDWWWLLPWKILDEGKCDLLLSRMNRYLQGKSRGWGRVASRHLREGKVGTKTYRGQEAG